MLREFLYCSTGKGSGEGQQQAGVHQSGTARNIIPPLVMDQARVKFFQLEAYLWHVWWRIGQQVAPEVSRTNQRWGWSLCCWVSASGSLSLLPAMQRQLWSPCSQEQPSSLELGAWALGLCRATWGLVQLRGLCHPLPCSPMLHSAGICSWPLSALLTKTPSPDKYLELHRCCKKTPTKQTKVKAFKLCFANCAKGFIKWIFLACHKNIKPHSYFYPFNLCKINWRHFTLLSFSSLTLRN